MRWAMRSRQRQWSFAARLAWSACSVGRRGRQRRHEQAHGLVQVAVHEHAQDPAAGRLRHVDDAHGTSRKANSGATPAGCWAIRPKKASLKTSRGRPGRAGGSGSATRRGPGRSGCRREVGHVVALLAGDLDEHGGVVDVRVGDGHAEPDVAAAAPAARAHQDELALGQEVVQPAHRAPHRASSTSRSGSAVSSGRRRRRG